MGDGPRHLPDFYYEEGHPINSEKQLQVVGGDIQSRSFLGVGPGGHPHASARHWSSKPIYV